MTSYRARFNTQVFSIMKYGRKTHLEKFDISTKA